jgi:hypothetical protein
MTDYIKREDAIKIASGYCHPANIAKELAKIPAADVREVVYCRDCKWTKTDGMDDPAIYCVKWDKWEMPNDGFCWHGRRR